MNQHALVVAKISEFVRLDFMLFCFVVIYVAHAGAMAPRAFHDTFLARKSALCTASCSAAARRNTQLLRLKIALWICRYREAE